MEQHESSDGTPVGVVLPADTVPLGLLLAAAVLRASGMNVNRACAEAHDLEITLRRELWREVPKDGAF